MRGERVKERQKERAVYDQKNIFILQILLLQKIRNEPFCVNNCCSAQKDKQIDYAYSAL